jgi:hypothetical protein
MMLGEVSHMTDVPDLNEGKPWSEMDLVDLRHSFAHGRSVAEIAEFLCRSEREVARKSRSWRSWVRRRLQWAFL